jgi:hypothetical protein
MRFLNRCLLAGVLSLSAGLVATAAAAASGTAAATPIKITNCTTAAVRPRQIVLACGDGNTALSSLRWSRFGGSTASARGTLEYNDCMPNCAAGHIHRYAITIKAFNLRSCRGGFRVYNKVTLIFAGRPSSTAAGYRHDTLGCPVG